MKNIPKKKTEKQKPTGLEKIFTTPTSLLEKIGLTMDPTNFGLPDLLKGGFPKEEQDRRLKECVEKHLYIFKDGRKIKIILIPQMVDFIADLFYERVQQAILWKPRGGGGSLCAAILIWLCMIYPAKSFIDMAGSGEQARRVYEYVCRFWDCVPGMAKALLLKDPLLSETVLKNGVSLTCVPASEKSARGRHCAGFVADESCSEDPRVGKVLTAALQGVFTEQGHLIVLLSTFHVVPSFFQQAWDHAEERGYKQYKWNVYDTMQECNEGLELASEDDPQARCFCQEQCPLTEREPVLDKSGVIIGHEFRGCNGKARNSQGHLPRGNVLKAKMLNAGGETWRVEHECDRPSTGGMIYDPEKVNLSLRNDVTPIEGRTRRSVGIDWGKHAVVVVAERGVDHVAVARGKVFENRRLEDIVSYLRSIRAEVGDFTVYSDAENRYGTVELGSAGFEVIPVAFNKHKEAGIENLNRYFNHEKIRILDRSDLSIIGRQLLTYHRDEYGKPVKKEDHGPDALLCACMHFPFVSEFEGVVTFQTGADNREGKCITQAMLERCIEKPEPSKEEYPGYFPPTKRGATMGVAVGSWVSVIISTIPGAEDQPRRALHIGKYRDLEAITPLLKQYKVEICCIAARPDVSRVQDWEKRNRDVCAIWRVEYQENGLGSIERNGEEKVLSVDRTTSLDRSYKEIAEGKYRLPSEAKHLAGGDFFVHLKASTRILDHAGREPVYRWESRNLTEHFRHAHNLDLVARGLWPPPYDGPGEAPILFVHDDGFWTGRL